MTAAQLADGMGVVRHIIRDIAHELFPEQAACGAGYHYSDTQAHAIHAEYHKRQAAGKDKPEEGMTVKQIAEAVGKDPATIARWIQAVSCKVQEVSRKVQEAKATSKPAIYTLAESCLIIEEGLGKAAADVYRTNAVNAKLAEKSAAMTAKPAVLPLSGAAIDRLIKLYGSPAEAAKRFDFLIGYPLAGLPLPAAPTSPRALPAPARSAISPLSHGTIARARTIVRGLTESITVDALAARCGFLITETRAVASDLRFSLVLTPTQAQAVVDLVISESYK